MTSTERSEFQRTERFGERLENLIGQIKQKKGLIQVSGLNDSALAYTVSRIHREFHDRPILLIMPNLSRSQRILEDLKFFIPEASESSEKLSPLNYFPPDEISVYSDAIPDRRSLRNRLRSLLSLQIGQPPPIVVAPATGVIRRVPPSKIMSQMSELVIAGEELDREDLIQRLVRAGFRRVSLVEEVGYFSVRGAVLDVFSPLYTLPVRIEMDGDLVESIYFFDPETQRRKEKISELLIGPVDEIFTSELDLALARDKLVKLAAQLDISSNKALSLVEELSRGVTPFSLRRYLPALYPELDTVFNYCQKNTIVFLVEGDEVEAEIEKYLERINSEYSEAVEEKELVFPPEQFFLSAGELKKEIFKFNRIEYRPFLPEGEGDLIPKLDFKADSMDYLGKKTAKGGLEKPLQPIVDEIKKLRERSLKVGVTFGTEAQALIFQERLQLYDVKVKLRREPFPLGREFKELNRNGEDLDIFIGHLWKGFALPQQGFALISEGDIFGRKVRKAREKSRPPRLIQAEELKPGELVIHKKFGMARYGGLVTLKIRDLVQDFLLLEYQGRDKLYLPVTSLDMIQKYTGGGNPPLDKLKGKSFEKKKAKAKKAIQALAGELLQLYAQRQSIQGTAFPEPDEAYFEFEAHFPYEETPDQWRAIQEVLADMQSPRCMDRIICGDVGYGKTEVAMRAAFLCAYSGKQVAVLVPTTVLAQQHGLTFSQRFSNFPVRVEVLSRFQTPKEKREILKDLAEGKIDIIIGTHSLLSPKVRFRNLGLLIVDEEHRFGVRHKEKLKKLRQDIDVLTLTATPIPRTLEMALSGLRDLSLIRTPPSQRLAVNTTVAPFSKRVIREAIVRELERDGQVFFVHNRISSIGEIYDQLREIVPEARIAVAHAKMPERDLERVMLDFIQGRYDVLLSTAIIESGLDIPRANTIIIDRAENFGLAQLYQLRGRVGRSDRRAYAILLFSDQKKLTPEAKERLETIRRFTELGSGLEIAQRDLELRGAGNILGKEQSGHINAIGVELFLEMLEETLAELQGKPVKRRPEPELNISVSAYISEEVVFDSELRLRCYRRLAGAEDSRELQSLREEFTDLFGQLPPEFENLLKLSHIKIALRELYALSGDKKGGKFRFSLPEDAPLNFPRILQHAQLDGAFYRFVPPDGIEFPLESKEIERQLDEIIEKLERFKAVALEGE